MKDNKPIYTNRAGTISVAIFEREFETLKGEKVKKFGTSLQRGYKKKDSDEWQNEKINFNNITELERAILLLKDVKDKILINPIEVRPISAKDNYADNSKCICGHSINQHDWDTTSECKTKGCKCKGFVEEIK